MVRMAERSERFLRSGGGTILDVKDVESPERPTSQGIVGVVGVRCLELTGTYQPDPDPGSQMLCD